MTLSEVLAILKSGDIVAYPTETFFGIAADPRNQQAVDRILTLKGRKNSEGILLIIDDVKRVDTWTVEETSQARAERIRLQDTFWPGPLTIVISANEKARDELAPGIFGPGRSLALRLSSEVVARQLAAGLGGSVTSTSANFKASAPAATSSEVRTYFPNIPILDQIDRTGVSDIDATQLPSTIVDVRTFPFKILRPGKITTAQLRSWL